MARLDEVRSAREGIAVAAGKRWVECTESRRDALLRLSRAGPAAADTRERVAAFQMMEARRGTDIAGVTLERKIGPTLDFTSRPPNESSRKAGRSVCRVVEIRDKGNLPVGFGTGFMVAPNLMITNHHVLPAKSEAKGIGANFGHEQNMDGLSPGEIFELDPDLFFENDEDLDFALVAVKSTSQSGLPLSEVGFNPLIAGTGKILIGHPINIIQYPEGGPKKYAVAANSLLDVLETFLHYQTDTLPGSSGSPAFNDHWEVVALHHSGVPEMRDGKIVAAKGGFWDRNTQSDDEINWIANEGIRVSRIMNRLRQLRFSDEKQAALLAAMLAASDGPLPAQPESKPIVSTTAFPVGNPMSAQSPSVAMTITGPTTINVGSPAMPALPLATERFDALMLEKKINFDENYGNRAGFDTEFLRGFEVGLPKIANSRSNEILNDRHGNPLILDYYHYSVVMNRKRRLQMWSAANVDYSPRMKPGISRKELGTDAWRFDPRVPEALQLGDDEFYLPAKKFDRGHIVRREDGAWGATRQEVEFSNADTFHFTNCTPQHEAFNRSNRNGVWGNLENHITDQAEAVGFRYLIFAGPILAAEDPSHDFGGGVRVKYPLGFWKVIAVPEDDGSRHGILRAYGFVLEQKAAIKKFGLEAFDVAEFEPYQRALTEIAGKTGVELDPAVASADVMLTLPPKSRERRHITKPADIHGPRSGRPPANGASEPPSA